MARAFTPQEKLALAITSAGSQRQLAALVGVSHQKIGRWLREGREGGAKVIPDYALPAIDLAFDLHRDVSRAQARRDRLPFDGDLPVYAHRPNLRKVDRETQVPIPGERVIVTPANYMSTDLREDTIAAFQKTGQFVTVSVQSLVNLYSYLGIQERFANTQAGRKIFKLSMLLPFRDREIEAAGSNARAPLNTMKENISPGTDIALSLDGVRSKLREKHEPHARDGDVGSSLLFTTLRGQYERFNRPASARNAPATLSPRPVGPVARRKPSGPPKPRIRDRR